MKKTLKIIKNNKENVKVEKIGDFNMRDLKIGDSSFKIIRNENGLFVDKSLFIKEIFNSKNRVLLLTRPRRFGKTTNLMMLKEFVNVKQKVENRKLFKNLKIEKTKTMEEHFGKYPVIFITFKDIKQSTPIDNIKGTKYLISSLYSEHRYLLNNLQKEDKKYFKNILYNNEIDNYEMSLKKLSQYLYEYWNEKVVILIDEYDTPLITSIENEYYDEIISFYRILYSAAFKDNEYLQKGVITGITQISKEGMFSGLNNLAVFSVLSEKFEKYFGFTEKEVEEILIEYNLIETFDEVKKWYDGYSFNGISIYNPWSILNYLEMKKLSIYWINTSSNVEITKLLSDIVYKGENNKIFDELEELSKGNTISVIIDENIVIKDLKNSNQLWNLMLSGGYLTSVKKERYSHKLKIPNYEIQQYFSKMFIEKFLPQKEYLYNVIDYLIEGEMKKFEKELKEYIQISSSYMLLNKEIFYQGFILGIFIILKPYFRGKVEKEMGLGRCDLYLESLDGKSPNYIIEFKIENNEDEIDEKLEKSLEQIKEKEYYKEIKGKNNSKIILMGIVFFTKSIKIKYEYLS